MEQGLGKYVDAEFIRTTSREMQEAMDMTPEEMDRAAHHLLMMSQTEDEASPTSPALSGAAARGSGAQPLTLALSSAFSDVDRDQKPPYKS